MKRDGKMATKWVSIDTYELERVRITKLAILSSLGYIDTP